MNNIYISIAVQIPCFLMLAILLVSQLTSSDRHKPLGRIFLAATSFCEMMLLFDIVSWALLDAVGKARIGAAWLLLISALDFLNYTVAILVSSTIILYIAKSIPLDKLSERRVMLVAWSAAAALFVLVTINLFTGWVHYIDADNIYHTGPQYWMVLAVHLLLYAVIVFIVLFHRSKLGARSVITYLSYVAFPIIALIINTIDTTWELAHVSAGLAILTIFVNIHMQREKKTIELEQELTQKQIAVMLSQIRPHFLYNSLSAIQDLCEENPKLARQAVVEFSQYLRGNLDSLALTAPIAFEREMKHAETYLALEKKRFEDKLSIVCDIKTHGFSLPALTLQPIVENAVRHGITKKEQGGTVTISTHETETAYIIKVVDDGVGFDVSGELKALAAPSPENGELGAEGKTHVNGKLRDDGETHIGIENVRSRLASMCGGTLAIESTPGTGTTAVIAVPK